MKFVAYLCVYVTFAMNAQPNRCEMCPFLGMCVYVLVLWTQLHLHAVSEVYACCEQFNRNNYKNAYDHLFGTVCFYVSLRVLCVFVCAVTILLRTLYNFTYKQAYNLLNSKIVRTSGWRKHGTLK